MAKTWEEYVSALLNIDETERRGQWLQGDILNEAKEAYPGRGFTKEMAAELMRTPRYIQIMMKVAKTFSEEMRDLNQPWQLYRIAASTDDPHGWIEKAINNGWSPRQLRDALMAEGDTGNEADKVKAKGERLLRSIKDWLEEGEDLARDTARQIWLVLGDWLEKGEES